MVILEVTSKLNKKIALDEENWKHIIDNHAELENRQHDIILTLKSPVAVLYDKDSDNYRYYKFFKSLQKYLLVIAKHFNDSGFIITAFYVSKINAFDMVRIYERNED